MYRLKFLMEIAALLACGSAICVGQTVAHSERIGTVVHGDHAWMTVLADHGRGVVSNKAQSAGDHNTQDQNAGEVTIFSNLAATYPNGLYWCCTGYNVMGPNSGVGVQWMAAAFTPDANHMIMTIEVAAGYSQQGTNGIVVSLNLDRKGKPGKALKKWSVSGLPFFGACCGLVSVSDGAGIAVNAGQQYWVVLSTDKSETDTVNGWNVDDTDQVNMATLASYSGTKWTVFQASPGVAFAVSGQ